MSCRTSLLKTVFMSHAVLTASSAQLSSRLCRVPSVWDFILLYAIYTATTFTEPYISPSAIQLPYPFLYALARFALWSLYGFAAGLVATGLWVIAHECGHQAFSESKTINNTVGWVLSCLQAWESHTTRGASRTRSTMRRRLTSLTTKSLCRRVVHS